MSGSRRVVVVGAGISGLACAVRLLDEARARGVSLELSVLEASDRAGGALGSEQIDGFVIERGGDGFLTEKPAALALARRLGIENRVVRTLPARQGALVMRGDELLPIPAGFTMMAATRARPILRSKVLSWRGKARLLGEVLVPRSPPRDDESLASFVRRRFGDEVLERLAQPLVAGIYGGDPERLSLRATMPRFLEEEQRSGSVTLGLRRKAKASGDSAKGARYSLFGAFDRGMQVLVDAAVAALPPGALRLSTAVGSLSPTPRGVRVRAGGVDVDADQVVLAVGARTQARLLSALDPSLARDLDAIEHGSCATVNLGFRSRVLGDVGAYGLVVPSVEARPLMAMTFASRKWPGRAPASGELVRVFLGGAFSEAVTESTDDALLAAARSELRAVLGVSEEPVVARLQRWTGAMPQYLVGHLARARAIEEKASRLRFLRLAGNSLHGVGIPDAIACGEAAATSVFS